MLCRNLLRCRRMSNLLRTYYPYTSDNGFVKRALDHDLTPPIGRLDFQQNENDFFRKILISDKQYVNTIAFLDYLRTADEHCTSVELILAEDSDKKPAYVLMCYLKVILKSYKEDPALIDSTKVVALCEALSSKIAELRDEHFWNLMKVLTLWPDKGENQQFFDLCKVIDEEAIRRSRKWGYDSILLTMDHFYRLKTIRYSEFVFNAMKRLWRNPTKLTPQQVVHAMFLVKTYRKWHPAVDLLDVESVLNFYIYDLSVEEVGILAIAFFKTQTNVLNMDLVESVYNKLETRIHNVDPLTLTAYLKFFRQCTNHTLVHKMKHLFELLTCRIDELPLPSCTHLAMLGVRQLVFHEPTIKKICERFYDNMESLRLWDLEKLALVLQQFNYIPDGRSDILERIVESIRQRNQEIEDYPHSFVDALYYLSLIRHYDYELINRALSINFLKKIFGSINLYSIPMSVVCLSFGVQLECPDYKGSYLGEHFLRAVHKSDPKIPKPDKKNLDHSWLNLFSLRNTLSQIFGDGKYVHMLYMFPYTYRPDVIFCLKDKKPVELPEVMLKNNFLPAQSLPAICGQWYTIVFVTKFDVIKESDRLTGRMLTKLRHVQSMNAKPIQIHMDNYEGEIDKLKYLEDVLKKEIA